MLARRHRPLRPAHCRNPQTTQRVWPGGAHRSQGSVLCRHRKRQRNLQPADTFMKGPIYGSMGLKPLGIFSLRNKKAQSARRSVLSRASSHAGVSVCVPLMDHVVQRLVDLVEKGACKPSDVFLLSRRFALDVVGELPAAIRSLRALALIMSTQESYFLGKSFNGLEVVEHQNTYKISTNTFCSVVSDGEEQGPAKVRILRSWN
jgi:hypothetical protein